MSDRTQDLKNLRAVATACKNYVDETKEQILWQVGQYNITTQDDNTIAYQKVVPTGATRVKIKSIGFMSYKCNNLLYNIGTTKTQNGLTFTISNGNIHIEGTPDADYVGTTITSYFPNNSLVGTYTMKNFSNDNNNVFFRITFMKNGSRIYAWNIGGTRKTSSYTFDGTETAFNLEYAFQSATHVAINENIMPMVVKGSSEPTEFQPYFENIRDNAVTSVKSYGANLFNIHTTDTYPYQYESWNSQPVRGDATNTYVENDTINCNSRVGTISYLGFKVNFTRTGTYIVAFDKDNTNRSCFSILNKTDMAMVLYREAITTSGRVTVTFTISDLTKDYYLGFTNYSSNSILSNIMLNYGSTALPYKPYRGLIDTFTIPDEIQSLTGYGRGINENCYNVLNLESKEFTDKDNLVDLGTLTYTKSANGLFQAMPPSDIKHPSSNTQIPNLLSAIYTPITSRDIYGPQSATPSPNGVMALAVLDYLFFNNTDYTDTSEFKTAMNGVNLQYELATYNITSNLALPDNVIEVEEGGYLVFENEFGQAVPSNITYRIEVAR